MYHKVLVGMWRNGRFSLHLWWLHEWVWASSRTICQHLMGFYVAWLYLPLTFHSPASGHQLQESLGHQLSGVGLHAVQNKARKGNGCDSRQAHEQLSCFHLGFWFVCFWFCFHIYHSVYH